MTDAIAHRGPDGEGYFTEDCVGLGHRRLAIIDLSQAGNQPMISGNKQIVLSYNGEHNFQELRIELEKLGHQFRSETDSEVVLNAWVEWGEECVHKFNGMFAFAVWDGKKHFSCKRSVRNQTIKTRGEFYLLNKKQLCSTTSKRQ